MSRLLVDASDAREPPNRVKPGIGFFMPEAPIPSWSLCHSTSVIPVSGPKLPCCRSCPAVARASRGVGARTAACSRERDSHESSSSGSASSLHDGLQPYLTSCLEAVA